MTKATEYSYTEISFAPGIDYTEVGSQEINATNILELTQSTNKVATDAIRLLEYPPVVMLQPIPESATGLLLAADEKLRQVLPPAIPDVTLQHNLAEEVALAARKNASSDELVLPPPLNDEDAFTITYALNNAKAADKVIDKYGKDAYETTLKKSRAMIAVAMADSSSDTPVAIQQYNRLRRGEELNESVRPLGDIDALTEKPIFEVPKDPLLFEGTEAHIVLSVLHLAALRPEQKARALAVKDFLSRYDPAPKRRALYAGLAKASGVDQTVGSAPQYPTTV